LKFLNDSNVQGLVLSDGLVEGVGEPFFEVLLAAENLWHQEVHQRPKLHDIVLQRGTCQEESALGVEPK